MTVSSVLSGIVRKTNYQKNLEIPEPTGKWYAGELPTTREVYGRIYTISKTDREKAKRISDGFMQEQANPNSLWYDPYLAPTSNSIKYEGQTQKAEQEWAAVQEEINYWTNRTDLNLSDDEIYRKVHGDKFSTKYPTLAKMDGDSIVNLNRVIGYSDDNMYTAIWRARNNGGTGDWRLDTAKSTVGQGNFWQEDPEISKKKKIGTDDCDIYGLGMTLEEEGLYFNVPEFTRETLDRINAELTADGWSDPVATKYYRNAEKAFETTEKLKADVEALYKDIDSQLPYADADTIIARIKDDDAYNDLFYLDKTMKGKDDPVKTTGPVNYRWADVEQYIRDKKAPQDEITGTTFTNDLVSPVTPEEPVTEEPVTQQPAPQEPTSQEPVPETNSVNVDYVGASLSFLGGLLRNWLGGNNESQNESIPEPQGTQPTASSTEPTPKPKNTPTLPPQDETDAALEEEDKRNRDNTGAAVYQEGTPEELLVFRTANAGNFGTMSDTVAGAKLTPEQARAKREKNLTDDTLSRTYTDGFRKILQYGEEEQNLETTEKNLSFMNSVVEELQKVMIGESPSDALLNWLPDEYKDTFILYPSVLNRIGELENKAAEWEEIEGYNVRETIQNIDNDYQAQLLNNAFTSLQEGNNARMEADGVHDNLIDIYQAITGEYVDPASDNYNEAMRIGQQFYDYLSSTGGIGEDETDELRELEAKKAEAEGIFREYKQEADNLEKAVAKSKGILSTMQGDYDEAIAMRNDLHNMWESYGEDYEGSDISLQETVETTISAATRYNAPQYLSNTYWHSMVETGYMTQSDAVTDAKKFVNDYGKYIEEIEKGLELDKTKHFLTDQERQVAENNYKVLQDQLAAAGDFLAMSNINIDEKAQEAMDKGVTDDMSELTKANVNALLNGVDNGRGFEFLWESLKNRFTGMDDFSMQFVDRQSPRDTDAIMRQIEDTVKAISDDEKELYFYYLATDGEDAANAYFQRLVDPDHGIVHIREWERSSEELKEQAGNFLGWGLSFLVKPVADLQAAVGGAINTLTGDEDSPYGNQYIGMQGTQDIRESYFQNVKKDLGGLNEDGTNNGWGDAIDFVLNGATSSIDSLINSVGTSAAFDIIGEAIPIVGKVMGLLENASEGENFLTKFGAKFVQDMSHAMPMAFGAALQTVREWKIKGADPDQLKGIFEVTLFAESVSEALSYENIKGAFQNGESGAVKSFIKEYFGGGLNEALGEGFNTWWENNGETAIMKEMSQYSQIVSYYHDELHLPMSVAEEMASQEMTKSIVMAAAEGFFSSSLSQTAGFVAGFIQKGRYNTAVNQYNKSSLAILSGLGMKNSRISGKNNTTASAAISGILRAGTGDVEGSKAASTHLVNAYGIDTTTSMMRGVITEAGKSSPKASAALNFGALTNGKTSEAVQKMAAKAQNGEKITSRDVSDMLDAFDEEQGDETLNTMYKQAVKGNKIASETLTNLANPVSAKNIKDASDAVRKAEQTKEMRTREKEEAQDKYDAVSKNADEAAQTTLDNPGDNESLGNLEQTMNQKAGAYRDVQQREAQEKVQEEKVKEEKEKAEQVNKEEMANARAQAKATVEQEEAEAQAAEEQQVQDAYAESVASNPPTDAFGQSIEIQDDNGNAVNVTGVYDQTDDGWVFTTEDGRLITVTNDLSHADPGIWDAMNKFEDRGHQPQNRPAAYMEQSIKGTTRNGEVTLIGLAGVENNNGIPDPVFMGSDGQIYRLSDVRISNDDIDYAYDVVDSRTDLPVIKSQQQSDIQALNKEGSKQELEDTTPEFDTKVEQRRNQYVYNRGLKVAQEKYNLTGEQAEAYARSFLRGYQNRNTVDFSKPVSNREAKRLIYKMAKRLGLKVVYEDMPNGYDGHYADGVVTLNKNIPVGQALMRIAGHEFTHSLEQTKSYEAFSNFVQEYLFKDEAAKEQAIQDMITKYKGYKVNLTKEQALKEIVADFTMNNLANKDVVNRLIDRGLGGRIRAILQKITSLFKGQNLSPEQKVQLNKLREAESLFKQAMQDRMNKALAEITPEQQAEADQAIRDAIANPVKQFSLGNTVEMREDGLMAVHNLSERSLWSILKMGGIPMPSIAVKKKGSFWSDYGEISIFFGREAVDPFYGNVVYTGDAMTPSFSSATINTAEEGLEYLKKQPARDYMSLGTLTALFNSYKRVRSLNEMRANAYRERISPEDKKIRDELISNMTERFKYAFEYQGNISPAQFNALKYMTPINRGIFEAYEELEEMNADGGMTDDQIRAYYADSIKHNLRIAGLKDDIDFESRPGLIDSAIKACDFIVDHIASDTTNWDMQEAKTPEILHLDKDVQAILLPSTVPSDIIDALKDAGVSPDRIRYYEGKSTGVDRHEAMKAITEQIPGVAFSTGNTDLYNDVNEFANQTNEGEAPIVDDIDKVGTAPSDNIIPNLRALSTDYQDAVNRGDMEAAQRDVESYAESKGYTDHGYHGSDSFGFTEFDLEEGQGTIFISYDKDLATTYTRSNDVKPLTDSNIETSSPEALISLLQTAMQESKTEANVSYNNETGTFDIVYEDGETESYTRDEVVEMLERFDEDLATQAEEDFNFFPDTPIADELRSGVYDLYARPGNQLVIDGGGKPFGDTIVPWSDKPQTTREIAEYARANGYDSVRINNIIDRGHNFNKMGLEGRDIGIFFNQDDVKSADTVTRDDNGNVIPLKERFSDDSDIRYSVGNNLTDADVQADLREAGLITDESVNAPVQALRVTRRQTPTQQQAANANAKYSPATIAKNLAKKLGIGDYIGTSKFGDVDAQAYFDRHSESAVVRTADAGDYTVTIHELGHAIAKMFNLTPTPEMMADFRRIAPSFFTTRGYTAAQLPGEAIAEFMWRYMEGEQQGRAFAGDAFYDSFEAAIRGTEAGEAIAEAREQLQTWINADTNAKIGTTIVNRSDKTNVPLRQRIQEGIDALVDNTSAAQNFDNTIEEITGRKSNVFDKVRQMALWANTAGKQATSILMGSGLTDAWGNVIGDSLADRFASVGFKAKGNNLDLLNRYMLALHSLDRDAQGKPVFDDHITPQERQTFIDDVRQNHPEVAAAEVQFQAFRREFLQEFLVNTGRLTQEAFDKMNAMYPHYVPTFRVKATDGIAQRTGKGKTYKIQRAKGSTENIYNPFDSFCGMVNTIVSQNALNRAGLAFDRMYQQNEGLGMFARLVPNDSKASTNIDMTKKQQDVFNLVDGMIDTATMAELMRIVGGSGFTQENTNSFDTLKVVRPDGTIAEYQFNDMELFKLLAGVNNKTSNAALDALGFVTRGMSALTTGSNPIFAARNFMRDFQNSVNYGSWASNYGTGVMKWLAAAYQVWKESDDYKDYVALGGGGWTRIDPSRVASRNELYSGIFEGYETSNLGKTVKWAGKKVWNALTLARLNEIIEQTSRFAEYRYGKHDLTTEEGRLEGYLAGQEATVDFNRAGNSGLATMIKKLVPFFNASAQGVYRTTRMLTKAERERAPERFAKTVLNTALLSALSTALLKGNMDDDDKKEFEMLSDDLKSKHFYLPNFAPDILGEAPLIRIPLAQDPLTYAIHGAVTNVLWSGDTEDGLMIDLGAIADTIVDNMNPIGSGTILAPILAINANKSWFGSRIVPSYLERNKYAPDQYTEETPEIFRTLGRMTNMSPLKLQYLAEQYTGFLGQLAIPALSKDSRGVLGGVNAAINAARKRFVSDPLTSNDVVSSFYDGSDILNSVIEETNQGKPLNILRRGLTQEEAGQAYEDAKSLYSGLITDTKNKINALYTEIDNINENPSLSDHDKYELTSAKRRQMIELALTANEKIGEYKEKYITGKSVVMGMLTEGTASYKPTDVEKMSDTFKADIDNPDSLYMQRALSVYNGDQEWANKQAALPHPSYEFTLNTVNGEQDFVISEDERELYDNEYKRIYEQYVTGGYSNLKWSKKARQWDTLTSEERYNVLKNAATYANGKMKDLYVKNNHIQLRKD